jgi:hypothetical protein
MISGAPAEREDRQDEAERGEPEGTVPPHDNREQALTSALSTSSALSPLSALLPEHAHDKREEAPKSLEEAGNPPNDKFASTQEIRIEEESTRHSESETTLTSSVEDKQGYTLPPLDKKAQDNNEDGDEDKIPPPLFKKNPDDNKELRTRPSFDDRNTKARMEAIAERKSAQAISSPDNAGWQEDKAKPRGKATAALQRTAAFPLGHKPFVPRKVEEDEAMQLFPFGHVSVREGNDNDNIEEERTAISNGEGSAHYNQDFLEEWIFSEGETSPAFRGDDVDYSSDKD